MKLTYQTFVVLVGIFVIISACTKDSIEKNEESCDTVDVTYTSHVAEILNASCAVSGCHVGGGQSPLLVDFLSASEASTSPNFIGSIKHEAGFTPMPFPPGSSQLEQCNIDIIDAWITAGSPE